MASRALKLAGEKRGGSGTGVVVDSQFEGTLLCFGEEGFTLSEAPLAPATEALSNRVEGLGLAVVSRGSCSPSSGSISASSLAAVSLRVSVSTTTRTCGSPRPCGSLCCLLIPRFLLRGSIDMGSRVSSFASSTLGRLLFLAYSKKIEIVECCVDLRSAGMSSIERCLLNLFLCFGLQAVETKVNPFPEHLLPSVEL